MGCLQSCFPRQEQQNAPIRPRVDFGPVAPEGLSIHEMFMYKMRFRNLRNSAKEHRPNESLEMLRTTAFDLGQEKKLYVALKNDREFGATAAIEDDPKSPGSSIVSFVFFSSEEEKLV